MKNPRRKLALQSNDMFGSTANRDVAKIRKKKTKNWRQLREFFNCPISLSGLNSLNRDWNIRRHNKRY